PGRPRELPHGRHRGRGAEPRRAAQLGGVAARRQDGHPRHPGDGQRRAQRLRRHQGDVQDRRRGGPQGDRSDRRPVAEALGGLRHHHQPGERHRRGRVIERPTVTVIGAGHAGLAASRVLAERSIDHVVLERGDVANSWRRERWDSLRLLTPNWQSRLPGHAYDGSDPDGYMTAGEVAAFITRYAALSQAPVRSNTAVTSLTTNGDGYRLMTSTGELGSRCVVIASGACNLPSVPALRAALPPSIVQFTTFDYRKPGDLPEG